MPDMAQFMCQYIVRALTWAEPGKEGNYGMDILI